MAFRYCPECRAELVTGERGGRERKLCPDCSFVHWNNPTPVVAAIVENDGHVILVRSRGRPSGWFGLVAGFLERDESPLAGALREVAEETGIEADTAQFVGVYPFFERNQIIFVYHVEAPHREVRLCEQELAEYRAVPIARLRPWSRGTGPALAEWLAERGYTPAVAEFGEHLDE